MRRGLAWVALLLGVALILTAWSVQAVPGWAAAPGGLLVLLFFWWEKVLTWAERVRGLTAPTAAERPTPSFGSQAAAGEGGQAAAHTGSGDIIQVGRGIGRAEQATYIETQIVQPRSEPRRDLVEGGAAPAARSEVYVPRGIEGRVLQALEQHGLAAIVGLTGPGGVGKTHMALHLAGELQRQGRVKRVFWLTLADREAEDLWADLAAQLGLDIRGLTPAQVQAEVRGRLAEACRERPCLVVLDDARPPHLQNGLLRALLPPRPCLGLVTSRVRTLPVPETFHLNVMTEDQARELLRQVLGAEALEAEPRAVHRLLDLTRRHPLALDVAARRVRQRLREGHPTPVAAFVQQLERLGLPALQADLAVTRVLQLSLEMLPEDEQAAFRALAALDPAGFHLRHAAGLWGLNEAAAEARLERWYDLSLVQRLPQAQPRYRLHDLYHDLALHLLPARGGEDAAFRALAHYLLEEFDRHALDDPDQAPHLATAFPHLARAAAWARARNDGETLARLATVPRNWLRNVYHRWPAWRAWLEAALNLGIPGPGLKANTLQAKGDVLQFQKDLEGAMGHYRQALDLFRQVHDRLGQANTLAALSRLALQQGRDDEARRLLNQAIAMHRAIGDRYSVATDHFNFGLALLNLERPCEALPHLEQALEGYNALNFTALVARTEKLLAEAREACGQQPAREEPGDNAAP